MFTASTESTSDGTSMGLYGATRGTRFAASIELSEKSQFQSQSRQNLSNSRFLQKPQRNFLLPDLSIGGNGLLRSADCSFRRGNFLRPINRLHETCVSRPGQLPCRRPLTRDIEAELNYPSPHAFSADHTSHHRWQAFIKRIEMPDAFVFLSSPNHFIRVPKDALSSSDREHILHWSSTVPTASGQ